MTNAAVETLDNHQCPTPASVDDFQALRAYTQSESPLDGNPIIFCDAYHKGIDRNPHRSHAAPRSSSAALYRPTLTYAAGFHLGLRSPGNSFQMMGKLRNKFRREQFHWAAESWSPQSSNRPKARSSISAISERIVEACFRVPPSPKITSTISSVNSSNLWPDCTNNLEASAQLGSVY